MTFRVNVIKLHVGSIESVTGWPGAHSDDPPSTGPATTPDAKHKKRAPSPGVLTFSKVCQCVS